MSAIADRLRTLPARWSESREQSRARKRERELRKAHADAQRDPNPDILRRHGQSFRDDQIGGQGGR
ncbi:MAG TPA: hypothetical protein VH834_23530 [Solirubrobacteraceae bacterium]